VKDAAFTAITIDSKQGYLQQLAPCVVEHIRVTKKGGLTFEQANVFA